MTIQGKDRELLDQLVDATRGGRVTWEPTANLDEFTASFGGKYSVVVAKRSDANYTLRMLDELEREMLKLDYEYQEYASPDPLSRVMELFDLARRTALHVEEAITDILGELKGS